MHEDVGALEQRTHATATGLAEKMHTVVDAELRGQTLERRAFWPITGDLETRVASVSKGSCEGSQRDVHALEWDQVPDVDDYKARGVVAVSTPSR
jgi:hypothetical protein